MAKITRKVAKIFGFSAGANEIAEFGSLAVSAPVYSTDPATIQSLAGWLGGWFDAVIGSNSPAIEDMNAFCYVMAYQIAYLMQEGVPEWEAGTTYFIGSLAQDGTGLTYVSLTNTNLNNILTDGVNWGPVPVLGTLTPNTIPTTITVPTGDTLTWPNPTLASKNMTVSTGANLLVFGTMIMTGTANLTLSGTANARFI